MLDLDFVLTKREIKWLEKKAFPHFNMKSLDDLTEDNFLEVFDYLIDEFEAPLASAGYLDSTNRDLSIAGSIVTTMQFSKYY